MFNEVRHKLKIIIWRCELKQNQEGSINTGIYLSTCLIKLTLNMG